MPSDSFVFLSRRILWGVVLVLAICLNPGPPPTLLILVLMASAVALLVQGIMKYRGNGTVHRLVMDVLFATCFLGFCVYLYLTYPRMPL